MQREFYELQNVVDIENPSCSEIPRTKSLIAAVNNNRDYSFIKLVKTSKQDAPKLEGIVVEVTTDGVPPNNPNGILYRERIILWISESEKELVRVWSLRKDFPILIHLNQSLPGAPASLCLYFEPTESVLRTWTPQKFLRRIQWWLEASAKNELHPADQPVEQLFFRSPYELVLPWNFKKNARNVPLRIYRSTERPDGGATFILASDYASLPPRAPSTTPIELTMPAILQGTMEQYPATLGGLVDILAARNINFIEVIKSELQQQNTSEGLIANTTDNNFCVLLLAIPVKRGKELPPDSLTYAAFLINEGMPVLGEALGVYFKHEGKYYNDTLLTPEAAVTTDSSWRDKSINGMEILNENDSDNARKQSGIPDEGPKSTIIGAGALGSALLNIWTRCGWGKWTIIDNDHIKPHNLSRHTAFFDDIGEMKAKVIASLQAKATHKAAEVTAIVGSAGDNRRTDIVSVIKSVECVIDVSTTLEYPRYASLQEDYPRHVSAFLTPNGSSAVLLAEDKDRKIRLRTIEAQYYRAIINSNWGKDHLEGNLGTFWSGAGCRDISTVMPYSAVTLHASILSDQIRYAYNAADASIKIWESNLNTGAIIDHTLEVFHERKLSLPGQGIYIDEGLISKLREMRAICLPDETGGVLLGYFDFNCGMIVVVDALPAPPDSECSEEAFERGIAGVKDAIEEASKRTAGIVGYIGEWHSHPNGYSASPSRDDFRQLAYLSEGMAEDGLSAVQLIVGENEIQLWQGSLVNDHSRH